MCSKFKQLCYFVVIIFSVSSIASVSDYSISSRNISQASRIRGQFHIYDSLKLSRKIPEECRFYNPDENWGNGFCNRIYANANRSYEISEDIVFLNKAFWRDGLDYSKRSLSSSQFKNKQEFLRAESRCKLRIFLCLRP